MTPSLRRTYLRVALGATLIVAVAYLTIAGAVLALATSDLTGRVDQQIVSAMRLFENDTGPAPMDRPPPPGRSLFGPILLVWRVDQRSGEVTGNVEGAALPASAYLVKGPETVRVNGEAVRIVGSVTPEGRLIVGQSLAAIREAENTILVAEALIGPLLLLVVFVGALLIGNRVAAPVERARRRQLDFTADASHELRTPVAVIEAQTSLALSQERSIAWYRAGFERIGHETQRMRRLVDDLLWLARFDAGAPRGHAEPVDLGVLADQMVERFRILADGKGLELALDVRRGPVIVKVPVEWADRLLSVLLDNACKYAPSGGNVDVIVRTEAGRAIVSVEDSGPGIAPPERARIFDRFHRATSASSGAGLGLAIGDSIVRATNGRWSVGSSPSGGASLSVSWPSAFEERAGRRGGALSVSRQPQPSSASEGLTAHDRDTTTQP